MIFSFDIGKRATTPWLCSLVSLSMLASVSCWADSSDNLDFSGFGRVAAGYLDTNSAHYKGYSDQVSLKPESLIGLQSSYRFMPQLELTVQGIVRADESNNDSVINWAYLNWQPYDNLMVKAGRLRTPFFALSDVVDVGYSYPWITPPQQVYSAWLFPTFDGIDMSFGHSYGAVDTSLETYVGRYDGEMKLGGFSTDYTVPILGGVIGKVTYDNIEFRVSHHRGKGEVDFELEGMKLDDIKFLLQSYGENEIANYLGNKGWFDIDQLSLGVDSLSYFTRAEWVLIQPDMPMLPDIESYYLSAGYNAFPFTFHVTFAQSLVDYPSEVKAFRNNPMMKQLSDVLSNDSLRSWTFGTRYDVYPKVALKAEWTLLDGDNDKNSFFDSIKEGFSRDASLYKLSVEWVF